MFETKNTAKSHPVFRIIALLMALCYLALNAGVVAFAQSDTQSPTLADAQAVTNTEVKIVFSEGVNLPITNSVSAFSIKNLDDGKMLPLQSVTKDPLDTAGKTVIIKTAPQVKDATYEVVAAISITDFSGNPITSGTSDTANFKGTDKTEEKAAAPETAFKLEEALAMPMSVELKFSAEVKLGLNPLENFKIVEKENSQNSLQISAVQLKPTDNKFVLLRTEAHKDIEYVVVVTDLLDVNGKAISAEFSSLEFKGFFDPQAQTPAQEPKEENSEETTTDTKAPLDVTSLLAESFDGNAVKLSWLESLNLDSDLAEQTLYISRDGGKTFDQKTALEAKATKYEIKGLAPKTQYVFKITTRDSSGNESEGASVAFTIPELTETGADLGILTMGSLLGALYFKRRKILA
jgi:methionine-rich copper-binding protein CopC